MHLQVLLPHEELQPWPATPSNLISSVLPLKERATSKCNCRLCSFFYWRVSGNLSAAEKRGRLELLHLSHNLQHYLKILPSGHRYWKRTALSRHQLSCSDCRSSWDKAPVLPPRLCTFFKGSFFAHQTKTMCTFRPDMKFKYHVLKDSCGNDGLGLLTCVL